MTPSSVSIFLMLTMSACGSSQSAEKKTITTEVAPTETTRTEAKTAAPETSPAPKAPALPVGPSPIGISNGLLYDGYIVGGLPTKEQIDQALQANIESAISLMARDEPGISVIGPYAASQGFRYIRFTIDGPKDLNEAMAWEFASTLPMLDKPGIVHSAKGQRVAAIFALKAFFVDEASAEEALAIGLALGMGEYEGHVRKLLEREPK